MQVLAHLWTQAPAPNEYVEYALCKEFHKLPSELQREPLDNVLDILTIMGAESKVREAKKKVKRRG